MLTGPQTHDLLAERVRKLFGTVPCRLQVAALPWRRHDDDLEIMLITSRDTGRWVLPKGWPEAREPLCEAALREAGEEAGLSGTDIHHRGRPLLLRQGAVNRRGSALRGAGVSAGGRQALPSAGRKGAHRTRKWVPAGEAVGMVNEPDLGQIIAYFSADPERFPA